MFGVDEAIADRRMELVIGFRVENAPAGEIRRI